jgi:hypothetical protein
MVLLLGAILLVMATVVFALSVNNSSATSNERARAEATLSAESALAYLRNGIGSKLLALDERGGRLPDDSGPFGLYRREGRFWLAYSRLSPLGESQGLHSLASGEALPDAFDATALKAGIGESRWWIRQLGPVRWIPLAMGDVVENNGLVPAAVRQVEVVGESGAGRAALTQTLRLAVDLGDRTTARRPEVALAAVPVSRFKTEQRPVFLLRGSADQPSRVRIEGPLLVDAPAVEGEWLRLEGKAKMTVEVARDPATGRPYGQKYDGTPEQPLNQGLFALAGDREQSILMSGGERRAAKPGDIDLDSRYTDVDPQEAPGTLQLTEQLARFIGRAGTVVRKDFNPQNNLLNPAGEKIYDARRGRFDFRKARRGILYFDGRTLKLKGEPYRLFTYQGQGTLVITARNTCLELENVSLVAASAADHLTIVCAARPDPTALTPPAGSGSSTPGTASSSGPVTSSTVRSTTDTTVNTTVQGGSAPRTQQPVGPPPGVHLVLSAAIPATILADEQGVPVTVRNSDVEIDAGAPPTLPTTVRRLIGSVNVGETSVPSGARAVTLDRRNYVLARVPERGDEPEVPISIGINRDGQRASVQYETVRRARAVPLVRLDAHVYSNAPFSSEGSVRVVGTVFAPGVIVGQARYAANTQNLLYGDNLLGLRFLFEAIYRRGGDGPGDWLMTFRPRQIPQPPQAVRVARIDSLLWQRLDTDRWRAVPTETSPEEP